MTHPAPFLAGMTAVPLTRQQAQEAARESYARPYAQAAWRRATAAGASPEGCQAAYDAARLTALSEHAHARECEAAALAAIAERKRLRASLRARGAINQPSRSQP